MPASATTPPAESVTAVAELVRISVPQTDGDIRINPFDDRAPRKWKVEGGVISVPLADVHLVLTRVDGASLVK